MLQEVQQLDTEIAEIYAENQALNKQQITLNDEASSHPCCTTWHSALWLPNITQRVGCLARGDPHSPRYRSD